jgi:hypothetical protein
VSENLSTKILRAHLLEGELAPGAEMGIRIDRLEIGDLNQQLSSGQGIKVMNISGQYEIETNAVLSPREVDLAGGKLNFTRNHS